VDGRLLTTLRGDRIVPEFIEILDDYVKNRYGRGVESEPALAQSRN
jgi:(E)-4-hydroxy-3-methylbut-2-enyl-diphosphate synthase